jgi:hypothetical protein
MAVQRPDPPSRGTTTATSQPANADDRQPSDAPRHTTADSQPLDTRITTETPPKDVDTLSPSRAEKDVGSPAPLDWPSDPANPLNWAPKHKWLVALTVSVTGFLSTMGSSMAAPLGPQIGQHFGEEREKGQSSFARIPPKLPCSFAALLSPAQLLHP